MFLVMGILLPFIQPAGTAQANVDDLSFYTWNQYQGSPTRMLGVRESFCALQSITGNLRGQGERVWIRSVDERWELNGQSGQEGLFARAICVPFHRIRHLRYWDGTWEVKAYHEGCGILMACSGSGLDARVIGTPTSFCYITGMGGEFNGDGELVRVMQEGEQRDWELYTEVHADDHAWTFGEAGCITPKGHAQPTDGMHPYTWNQGELPTRLIPADLGMCVLNAVHGEFLGHGEEVSIYESDGWWVLGGRSQQEGVGGAATCLMW